MDLDNYSKLVKESKEDINKMKITKDVKEKMFSIIDDLEKENSRIINYFKLNEEVYLEEKEILINNFIAKDNDVNYLYNQVQNYEKNRFYRIYNKIRKFIKR